jgi:hypothetical protein
MGYNQLPENLSLSASVLMVMLRRKREVPDFCDFMSATSTTINPGVGNYRTRWMENIEGIVVGRLQELLVLKEGHRNGLTFFGGRKTLYHVYKEKSDLVFARMGAKFSSPSRATITSEHFSNIDLTASACNPI